MNPLQLATTFSLLVSVSALANWPQASGPDRNYQVADVAQPPTEWSVARDKNIRWRTTMPEGGQSAVTIWEDRAFVTTHRPMKDGDELTEPNVVGYCLNSETGEILWQVDLPGTDPVKTAGIFSDATVFSPVTDGEHVWFFNRCGSMGCFDMNGKQVWLRKFKPRPRHTNRECEPVLFDGTLLSVEVLDKEAGQKMQRHKPVPEGIDPKSVWTYLHGIDARTGEVKWVGKAGTAVHNNPMVGQLKDGRRMVMHGRGGGHGPLEKPYGLTLTSAENGEPLWSYEVEKGGDCTFNSFWDTDRAFWFQKQNHMVLDPETGKLLREDDVMSSADFCAYDEKTETWQTQKGVEVKAGKKHPLTDHANIVIGDWHYFLARDVLAVGRVNIKNGKTEYLQLPAQKVGEEDRLIWAKKDAIPNDTKNSRGIDIAPDKRAKGTGWGHVSAASPIAVNQFLFFPIMNGTVYVIDTSKPALDQNALVAINDLGPAGETWCLSSFTYSEGRLFIHTMKEVICLGAP